MGEVAEMMLDGTLCQGCGVFIDEDIPGYPRSCHDCKKSEKRNPALQDLRAKVKCPTCQRRVKAVGLSDHMRDSHHTTKEQP